MKAAGVSDGKSLAVVRRPSRFGVSFLLSFMLAIEMNFVAIHLITFEVNCDE
jgi:hypothetical protein